MNVICQAARMMGKRKIVRKGTAKTSECTIFLWELDDGNSLELLRNEAPTATAHFVSVRERTERFNDLLQYYERHAKVFSPDRYLAA
jgi:hypothetical protein